jgi:hypothetical protein
MAGGLVFDAEDEANRHEEQHPGMVRLHGLAPRPDNSYFFVSEASR